MRMGTFASPDYQFGIPVAVAKPKDNKMPLWDSSLLALNLSNEDLSDLQTRVNEVYQSLRAERDFRR